MKTMKSQINSRFVLSVYWFKLISPFFVNSGILMMKLFFFLVKSILNEFSINLTNFSSAYLETQVSDES